MDMFKLLARSSNLQKAPPTKHRAKPNIPSEGTLIEGNSENAGTSSGHLAMPRGTKRKRKQLTSDRQANNAPEIENLDEGNQIAQMKGGRTRNDQRASDRESTIGEMEEEPLIQDKSLSEIECRKILKKYKLKVTILKKPLSVRLGSNNSLKSQEIAMIVNHKNSRVQLSPQPLTSFDQLRARYGISRRLAENLEAQGYREPTGIQMVSLPLLLGSDEERGLQSQRSKRKKAKHSHVDLLSVAPTGSGKTLAFLIPALQGLLETRRRTQGAGAKVVERQNCVQVLIIAPTHELVDQIVNEGRKLAMKTGIKVSAMRKGMKLCKDSDTPQSNASNLATNQDGNKSARQDLLVKADVLVTTPLLLLHAISLNVDHTSTKPLPSIQYLILDEADVLLDQIFREQTLAVWRSCCSPSLRISLWSATIGSSIESLAQRLILDRRKNLGIEDSSSSHYILRIISGLKDSALPSISHRLVYAASEKGKLLGLRQLLHPSAGPSTSVRSLQPPFLVFTQTIERAIALHSELFYDIPPEAGGSSRVAVLHSDLSETARSNIMVGFRTGEIWILITTDLLSRGIDFRGMNGIVNYDIPNTRAAYVHRAGRTGRQGREGGIAVTFYTKEDIPYVKNIANVIAASEKAQNKSSNALLNSESKSVQKWLLDSLPNVSQKTRRDLKWRGVESRRTDSDRLNPKKLKKMRISTKSGYDRMMVNKRKGAIIRERSRQDEDESSSSHTDDWKGFE